MHELRVNLERRRVMCSWARVKKVTLPGSLWGFCRDTEEGPAVHCLIMSNKRGNLSSCGVSTAINSYAIIK